MPQPLLILDPLKLAKNVHHRLDCLEAIGGSKFFTHEQAAQWELLKELLIESSDFNPDLPIVKHK